MLLGTLTLFSAGLADDFSIRDEEAFCVFVTRQTSADGRHRLMPLFASEKWIQSMRLTQALLAVWIRQKMWAPI